MNGSFIIFPILFFLMISYGKESSIPSEPQPNLPKVTIKKVEGNTIIAEVHEPYFCQGEVTFLKDDEFKINLKPGKKYILVLKEGSKCFDEMPKIQSIREINDEEG